MHITQAQTARYSLRPQTKANVLLSLLLDFTLSLNFAVLLFNLVNLEANRQSHLTTLPTLRYFTMTPPRNIMMMMLVIVSDHSVNKTQEKSNVW